MTLRLEKDLPVVIHDNDPPFTPPPGVLAQLEDSFSDEQRLQLRENDDAVARYMHDLYALAMWIPDGRPQ